MSAFRLGLARGIWLLHLSVVAFLCVGWLLPWKSVVWAAVLFVPIVQLNWCVFGNRCVLTVIEEWLRQDGAPPPVPEASEPPTHFVSDLLSKALSRPVSRAWGDVVSYAVLWGGFALGSLRLLAGRV